MSSKKLIDERGCTSLTEIKTPDGVEKIGSDALNFSEQLDNSDLSEYTLYLQQIKNSFVEFFPKF